MQKRKYVYITVDSEHCFDVLDLISAVGVTDIYSNCDRSALQIVTLTLTFTVFFGLHA